MKNKWILIVCLLVVANCINAQSYISEKKENGAFPLSASDIIVSPEDHWLMQKTAAYLAGDIAAVTEKKIAVYGNIGRAGKNIILIGSLDKSSLIQQLASSKKINIEKIKGKWEGYSLQVVSHPFPGVDNALVIAGNDKRGTAFGVFDLSQQIGVSPGLKYAVSFDDEEPQIISINKDDNNQRLWNEWAATNIIIKNTKHNIPSPGKHVLKFWMVSPAVVLQKLVVDAGGVKQSYLGPPETK